MKQPAETVKMVMTVVYLLMIVQPTIMKNRIMARNKKIIGLKLRDTPQRFSSFDLSYFP